MSARAGITGALAAALVGALLACARRPAAEPSVVRGDLRSVVERAADAVCDRQIVLLGELPSHGEARAFQAKAAIVERLVERCGFDAVVFEAPVYDFVGFQRAVAAGSAEPAQLDRAIGRFWETRELAQWRRWLFGRATGRGLLLAGMDDQASATSEYARATLPGLVAAWSPAASAAECEQTVARHLFWRYDDRQRFDAPEQARLHRCARAAAESLATASAEASAGTRAGTRAADRMMLDNLATLADRQRDPAGAADRDEVMYRNILAVSERMPAGSRVVVWTATVHAARRRGDLLSFQPLGARLVERFGDRVAAIGSSAYAGLSARAGGALTTLPEMPPGSLEARVTGAGAEWAYVSARALREIGVAPSRLLGRLASADWSAYFDHVIVVREEVPPRFEARSDRRP